MSGQDSTHYGASSLSERDNGSVLMANVSWSIRLLFWPLGIVIKYRAFFGTVLPYLFVGVIALIVGSAALGLLGTVFRAVFVCVRGVYRFCATFIDVFRPSRKEEPQEGETINTGPPEDPNDPYHILGISRNATEDELNARYRQLLRVNHPDKVAQLDPEIQAFATERSRRIIEAYEAISIMT
jgi:hypothetical protein